MKPISSSNSLIVLIVFSYCFTINSVAENTVEDSINVYRYYRMADSLKSIQIDSAKYYTLLGLSLSEHNMRWSMLGEWRLAQIETSKGDKEVADSLYRMAIAKAQLLGDSAEFFSFKIDYGHLLYLSRQYSEASKLYDDIMPFFKAHNNMDDYIQCQINKAKICNRLNDYKGSMDYFLQALTLADKHQKTIKQALIWGNMGSLYFKQQDYDQSLSCFQKSLLYHQQNNNSEVNIAVCYQSIGTIFILNNNYAKAEENLLKASSYFKQTGLSSKYIHTLNSLGVLYKRQKNYEKAIGIYRQLLDINADHNDLNMESALYVNIGSAYREQQNYDKALQNMHKAMELLQNDEEGDLRDIYINMAEIYEAKGDYKNAFKWLHTYKNHADTIFNIKKHNETEALRQKYEADKKDMELAKVTLENDKAKAVVQRDRVFIALMSVLLILLVVFSIVVIKISRARIASYKELVKKSEQMLEVNRCKLNKALEESKHSLKQPNDIHEGKQIVPDHTKRDVLEKLSQLINEKFYCKADMSLNELAALLHTNSRYLSQIINEVFKCNVSNYINTLRIEEAQRLLRDNSNNILTIEVIGQHAGFKSKSVFNNAFKRITGVTPSFYKNQH